MIFEEALVRSISGSRSDLVDVISWINALLIAGKWNELDASLNRIEPGQVTDEALILWLRGSYPGKHNLPAFTTLVKSAALYFEKKGEDSNRMLQGLLNEAVPSGFKIALNDERINSIINTND